MEAFLGYTINDKMSINKASRKLNMSAVNDHRCHKLPWMVQTVKILVY